MNGSLLGNCDHCHRLLPDWDLDGDLCGDCRAELARQATTQREQNLAGVRSARAALTAARADQRSGAGDG